MKKNIDIEHMFDCYTICNNLRGNVQGRELLGEIHIWKQYGL